ncbi:MAG: M28 family peptidase [Clostridia bacterium]|nr:M28 family peptidase [Clostridia bacterium]
MNVHTEINTLFPVRNTPEQKQAFRGWALKRGNAAGLYTREENNAGHINIVFGDPVNADVVFTAHYDTPKRSLLPNIMLPLNPLLKILYTLAVVLSILLPALAAAFALMKLYPDRRELALFAYACVYFLLFYLTMRAFKNPHNANDNTSGTAAVMQLAERGMPGAAFILFDDEEKGKKGSNAYAAEHGNVKHDSFVINMDCIGNGNIFVVQESKRAHEHRQYAVFAERLKRLPAELIMSVDASMNSDHKNFDKSLGIAACLKGKRIVYTPRIHTPKDTVCDTRLIDMLVSALAGEYNKKPE